MFVTLHESFKEIVGEDAYLRLLVRTPDGTPMFHEAGIYLPSSNTVICSSNRLQAAGENEQTIHVVHIPLDAIPAPLTVDDKLQKMSEHEHAKLTEEDQQKLFKRLIIKPSNGPHLFMPNGATQWHAETVLWCEQGKHHAPSNTDAHAALVVYDPVKALEDETNGKTQIVLDKFEGKRFTSLNDVVCLSQSACVFFTDPPYGVEQLFKRRRHKDEQAYASNGLYVWHPASHQVRLLDTRYDKVNGCTFIPDPAFDATTGRGLLITTDTGRFSFMDKISDAGNIYPELVVDQSRPACIYAYPVNYTSATTAGQWPSVDVNKRMLVAHSTNGVPDGVHPDKLGNLWAGHGDGVHVYKLDWHEAQSIACANGSHLSGPNKAQIGTLIGKIQLPNGHGVANFCWAGAVDVAKHRFRVLLLSEDELWEAIVAINGQD